MPVHIEKSGDLVGCSHSGTNDQPTEQGKIELLSQWTMKGWHEQIVYIWKLKVQHENAVFVYCILNINFFQKGSIGCFISKSLRSRATWKLEFQGSPSQLSNEIDLGWKNDQQVQHSTSTTRIAGCGGKHRKNCECCPGHYLSTSVY